MMRSVDEDRPHKDAAEDYDLEKEDKIVVDARRSTPAPELVREPLLTSTSSALIFIKCFYMFLYVY
jgi:Asp-tRNA(Asn)/Glu-tRNA(Gln) amidotransferase B subunit